VDDGGNIFGGFLKRRQQCVGFFHDYFHLRSVRC
jgi:hypothetical protein